jgi:hypothetical protein
MELPFFLHTQHSRVNNVYKRLSASGRPTLLVAAEASVKSATVD